MTPEEEHALNLFVTIVAELNDAQLELEKEFGVSGERGRYLATALAIWMDTLRCGETQEDLNKLAMKLVEQREI